MVSVNFFLLLAGVLCELLAALGVTSRINLMAAGLFFWMLTLLLR